MDVVEALRGLVPLPGEESREEDGYRHTMPRMCSAMLLPVVTGADREERR